MQRALVNQPHKTSSAGIWIHLNCATVHTRNPEQFQKNLDPGENLSILLLQYYLTSITTVVVMSKTTIHRLGDLQLKIMKVLWDRHEATVAEVHKTLCAQADFAYTTIATMLRKMEDRQLVKHRTEERKFLYRPLVKAEEVTRNMSEHLMEGLFEGSMADMVCHLLNTHEVSREELEQLEKLIAERKKKL